MRAPITPINSQNGSALIHTPITVEETAKPKQMLVGHFQERQWPTAHKIPKMILIIIYGGI
jgi:hypothetical protein